MAHSLFKTFNSVPGHDGKPNTVLYRPSQLDESTSANSGQRVHVIFFPGDVQDFEAAMKDNPTAKQWSDWNFEHTLQILSDKFRSSHIWLVLPSKKIYKIFCVYKNFVKSESLFGVPEHEGDYGGLLHLRQLFENLLQQQFGEVSSNRENLIYLIGFSKGCIVLNQFLHEVAWHTKHLENSDCSTQDKMRLKAFIESIRRMYWLDGGHSGQKDIWVRNQQVLTPLKRGLWSESIKLFIHVTPYQIKDPIHPWKGEEEADFVAGLQQLGVDFIEKLHFDDESEGSVEEPNNFDKEDLLAKHFQIIKEF